MLTCHDSISLCLVTIDTREVQEYAVSVQKERVFCGPNKKLNLLDNDNL